MAEGYLANQKMVHCLVPELIKMMIIKENGALLSTSTHLNNDSKSLIIVHCLVPVLIATMIMKFTGAVLDILALILAVIVVTFKIQLLTSVTMIATMVLIIMI